MCKDLQHIRKDKHKLLDDFLPYILHFYHMNVNNKDLGIFLVRMQGDLGIQDQLYIQVLELKSHAFTLNILFYIKYRAFWQTNNRHHICIKVRKIYLRGLQSVRGEPMNPSGHVHSGSWLITLQIALGAQGFLSAHGFIHFVFSHALKSGHSPFS